MNSADMTKSSLRERFERLGRIQGIDPVRSGSPAIVSLRPIRQAGPDEVG